MKLYEKLSKDIRFIEGLQACINCGTCTAICPAAQFYDYDPRIIVSLIQKKDENDVQWRLFEFQSNWSYLELGLTIILSLYIAYQVFTKIPKFLNYFNGNS